jgi:hypothetical protein
MKEEIQKLLDTNHSQTYIEGVMYAKYRYKHNIKEIARTIKMLVAWGRLGDTPVNEEEEIDEEFTTGVKETTFEKGTCIYDIWGWFEEEFNVSVASELMNLK